MPSRNTIKIYVKDGHYHIYNRGVDKRVIFKDRQDHKVFLNHLKVSLSPPPNPAELQQTYALQGASLRDKPRMPKNFSKEIDLLAFCLMPNHFHLLIKQKSKGAMESFMRSITTRYSMYFNKKYDRVGTLFQGAYKAALILDDPYLLHLSRYIHRNPLENPAKPKNIYSSFDSYIGKNKAKWVKPKTILAFFDQAELPFIKKVITYKNFVEKNTTDSASKLGNLILES